jgi:hypothetical protein
MADTNPLGIIMHDAGDGPEAYLPLRHVPDKLLEQKRAELLEFNSKDGLRKLTDEERQRMDPAHADEPDTAENVQSDLDLHIADEADHAEPLDLMEGEGFG